MSALNLNVKVRKNSIKYNGVLERQRKQKENGCNHWVNFLCCLYFSICSTPVLLQQYVKYPSHFAKSASSRLQLNTHTSSVCGFK